MALSAEAASLPAKTLQVYLPVVMKNAYGGWTTGINLRNFGSAPANVTITYYGDIGKVMSKKDTRMVAVKVTRESTRDRGNCRMAS